MEVTSVTVKGFTYHVPTEVLNVALVTFDQHYRRCGMSVPALARTIANDLMPATREDMFSAERLARVILSLKGRKGGRKPKKISRPSSSSQLNLPLESRS